MAHHTMRFFLNVIYNFCELKIKIRVWLFQIDYKQYPVLYYLCMLRTALSQCVSEGKQKRSDQGKMRVYNSYVDRWYWLDRCLCT